MSGRDEQTGETWRTEEIPTTEARRLVQGAPIPVGLDPIDPPSFGEADQVTESLDTAGRGVELPDRYEVVESLGPEDHGDLFRVHDSELERDVVLKLLRLDAPGLAEAGFRDDARTVARIDHPGAVTVFDLGRLPDGRPYVTRALLEGRPLGRWAREVEVRRVVRWLVHATDTVAAAQAVGLVHRRLEPTSIVVGRVVKVRGFGSGVAEPSPFMAPELVRGEPSGPSADVFSLGAILADVLGEGLPEALVPVVERATSARAADRRSTAQALLADLEDWLDG